MGILDVSLGLLILLIDGVDLIAQIVDLLLVLVYLPLQFINLVFSELLDHGCRHATFFGLTTTSYSSRELDQLTVDCHNSVTLLKIVRSVHGNFHFLADKSVA